MILSKNFTLAELTKSNTALRLGIDNTPNKEGIYKLRILATTLLQPLRNYVGPIRVTSGFRSVALNSAIGGSNKSQHTKCEAVDLQHITRGKSDNLKIFNALISLGLEYDQCILEFGGATETEDSKCPDWIHISYSLNYNRHQILVAYKDKNNKTKYRKPLNYIG
jgi:hypothetical protein|tara:strand:+ start:343 stop:837 length:495 start_codon:yes stop_codon:yes gene_type:complete